jgi:ferritin-like metal-binding protein YciE
MMSRRLTFAKAGMQHQPLTSWKMTTLNTLRDLLIDELRDLHNAETQLVKALPKMAKAANNEELKAGFTEHLEQTKGHVERLERAFKILNETPKGKTCLAMKGLIEEGEEAINAKAPDSIRDANIIGAAQRVEHYEIAAYGTARSFAEELEEDQIASLLQETLDEESDTDRKLTALSSAINTEANSAGSGQEETSLRASHK